MDRTHPSARAERPVSKPSSKDGERQKRLGKALRANLLRRKQQSLPKSEK